MSRLTWDQIFVPDFEAVYYVKDEAIDFHAIIALHSTFHGKALGGTRARQYEDFDHALTDVLRLAKGMTYKSVMTGSFFGGGKSVIFLQKNQKITHEILDAFAEAINTMDGRYICAEDSGLTLEHLRYLYNKTPHIVGVDTPSSSGNPSRFTAFGTLRGIEAALMHRYRNSSLEGKTVAIQGLGSVGMFLADQLFWRGAQLVVCDLREEVLVKAKLEMDVKIVSSEEIYDVECDIFSPCALGGILNSCTIPRLKASIIAGCANNQLETKEDALELHSRNILYTPDYVINSGGLINVCLERIRDHYSAKEARAKVNNIYDELLKVFFLSEKENISPALAADHLVEEKISMLARRR